MALVPLTLIPLLLYGIAALFLYDQANYIVEPGQVALHPFWDQAAVSVTLVSGQNWALTYGDLLISVALILFLLSVLKSTSTGTRAVLSNMVMVLVLCVYIVLFLAADFAGTSVFFILMMIALIDTLATVSVSMIASHSKLDAVPD
ncbi:MAG: hypothetical protein AAGF49_08360 [Pseudomonadota bacterium]